MAHVREAELRRKPSILMAAIAAGGLVLGASGIGERIITSITPAQAEAARGPNKQNGVAQVVIQANQDTQEQKAPENLSTEQRQMIDQMPGLAQDQKDFLKSAVSTVKRFAAEGAPINQADVVAQTIIESDWGRQTTGGGVAGIKADPSWKGKTVTVPTIEYVNGVRQETVDTFRAYSSLDESIADYVHLVTTEDWAQDAIANADDPGLYLYGLQNGGPDKSYATAPNYTEIVLNVVEDFHLVELTSL